VDGHLGWLKPYFFWYKRETTYQLVQYFFHPQYVCDFTEGSLFQEVFEVSGSPWLETMAAGLFARGLACNLPLEW